MDLSKLRDGYKVDIISRDTDVFKKINMYTDYSIIKFKGNIYIQYIGITVYGKRMVGCTKVEEINSVVVDDGKEIIIPYSVELGANLKGAYSNGYNFNIPSILNIRGGVISNEDKKNCEEVSIC